MVASSYRVVADNLRLSAVVSMRPCSLLVAGGRRRALASPRLGRCVSGRHHENVTGVGRFRVRCRGHVTASFTTFVLALVNISLSSGGIGNNVNVGLNVNVTLDFNCVIFRAVSSAFTIGKDAPPVITI